MSSPSTFEREAYDPEFDPDADFDTRCIMTKVEGLFKDNEEMGVHPRCHNQPSLTPGVILERAS